MKKYGNWRSLFSNNWFCVVLILCEVGSIIPFFKTMADQSYALWIIAYIVGYATFLYIINQDERSSSKIPWICVVLIIPPFGALFYGLFHRNNLSRKDRRHLDVLRKTVVEEPFDKESLSVLEQKDREAFGKAKALLHDDSGANIYRNTISRYYPVGEEMYADMLEDLKQAKRFIFLEYFIVEEGVMWDSILEILREKTKAGVEVRMLYDDLCSFASLPMDYDKKLRENGIECYRFSKFTPIASTVHNNRDHRKIMVIDGRIGYTGGINLADEYINQKQKYGHWKDGGIRLEGDAVWGLSKLFLENWDMNQKTVSDYGKYHVEQAELPDGRGFYIPFGSGPQPVYQTSVGENVFLNLINQAKESVSIMTPYLIIDYELMDALRNAAIRGVRVTVITPHIPDKKLIFLMTRSNYVPLLEAGVEIYEYTPGFVHMKLVLVDGRYSVSGTINFDYRSLIHHYENAVWMYNTDVLKDMERDVEQTIFQSEKITKNKLKLNPAQKLLKSVIQLFAPLL